MVRQDGEEVGEDSQDDGGAAELDEPEEPREAFESEAGNSHCATGGRSKYYKELRKSGSESET